MVDHIFSLLQLMELECKNVYNRVIIWEEDLVEKHLDWGSLTPLINCLHCIFAFYQPISQKHRKNPVIFWNAFGAKIIVFDAKFWPKQGRKCFVALKGLSRKISLLMGKFPLGCHFESKGHMFRRLTLFTPRGLPIPPPPPSWKWFWKLEELW